MISYRPSKGPRRPQEEEVRAQGSRAKARTRDPRCLLLWLSWALVRKNSHIEEGAKQNRVKDKEDGCRQGR